MKCINPIVANYITQKDLSGNKKVVKHSFFNFRKWLSSVRIALDRHHSKDFIIDFSYSSDVVYEDYSYFVRQYYSAKTARGLDFYSPVYPSSFNFKQDQIECADDVDDVSYSSGSFLVRCRKCPSCILSSIREKTFRCVKEFIFSGSVGCMLTLTYRDECLPYRSSESTQPIVRYSDVQKFLKRLRKYLFGNKGGYLKYFACCEYSPKNNRPHAHIFLIGYDFGLSSLKKNPHLSHDISCAGSSEKSRCPYYMSKVLNRLWTFGRATISEATSATANYVAGYTMKKLVRPPVVIDGAPECHYFSTGLGVRWFYQNYRDILAKGFVVIDYLASPPFKAAIPSYFLRVAKIKYPFLYEEFIKKKSYLDRVTFTLQDLKLLDSLKINLEKKFAFLDR